MDSSVSQKAQFWFLRVCHHVPRQVYQYPIWAELQKYLKNERPTWCHLPFYFTSYVLNMFRTLIYPSSGACDCVGELPHRSSCSQFVVCWIFGAAGFRWCSFCRLKHNLCFSQPIWNCRNPFCRTWPHSLWSGQGVGGEKGLSCFTICVKKYFVRKL